MKRFVFRLLKTCGILVLITFLSAFVWANWEEPSPGMRASVVDFIQYDVSEFIGDDIQGLRAKLINEPGIRGVTYNHTSQLMVVCYSIDKINRAEIDAISSNQLNHTMKEKVFVQTGPKCPVDVAWISRIKKTLCIRD